MKHYTPVSFWLVGLLILAGMCWSPPARAQSPLQQVVSRENTEFSLTTPVMNVGLDGNVYIGNWYSAAGNSYLMRVGPTGTPKAGSVLNTEALSSVAANANGIIATTHAHFAHCVNIYNASFQLLATNNSFNGVNYDAPADVEAGDQSGNFYVLDQWNNRIVCLSGQSGSYGQVVATYAYPTPPATLYNFRVSEKNNIIYLINGYVNGMPSSTPIVAYTLSTLSATSTPLWSLSSAQTGVNFDNPCLNGGVALDTTGTLYTIGSGQTVVEKWNSSGSATGSVTLTGALTTNGDLRVYNGQAFVRNWNTAIYDGMLNTQLFQVFNLSGGALVRTVIPNEDVLTASYTSEIWTAGAVTPFTLSFTSAQVPTPTPSWHVWGRPFDSAVSITSNGQVDTTYQDFGYTTSNGGQITVPAGCNGLYQIKVTPEQAGWQRGTASEYFVNDVVEIRPPSAVGAISVYTIAGDAQTGTVAITNGSTTVTGTGTSFTTTLYAGNAIFVDGQFNTIASVSSNTQLTVNNAFTQSASGALLYLCPSSTTSNRLHYNAGDTIPFTVSVRCPTANLPSSVTVNLTDMNSNVLASGTVSISSSQTIAAFYVPGAMTAGLLPGSYTLQATNSGFTCVPQPIIIGAGLQKPPSRFMLYGDYGNNFVNGTLSQERDLVANQAVSLKKLGVNQVVDRLGYAPGTYLSWSNQPDGSTMIGTVQSRLSGDPTATDPAKAAPEPPLQQTVAAYSAGNTEQQSILMYNDAGIPLGTGFDSRSVGNFSTPGTFEGDLTTMTNALLPYSSFRGWSWAANWWNFNNSTDQTFTQTQINTYNSDLATAQSSGVWNSSGTGILDAMANSRLNCPTDAWTTLASTPVIQANPQLVQMVGAPIRNNNSYPPDTFTGLSASDGQAQWEQYMLPWHTMWNIDYHKMSGEKGYIHPEIWNDSGTGEQILQNTFMALLRQPDGEGCSTNAGGDNIFEGWQVAEDTRCAMDGTTSVYRAMNTSVLQPYGPWLTTLTKNSRTAIVVSERQAKIDAWPYNMPTHYGRLYEAYVALMHCHEPADLIFTTNMTATSLEGYKAVFLVDQWVELDGNSTGSTGGILQTALTNAHNAGAKIFYDGDCKDVDNVFSTFGATALGISFNQFQNDSEAGNDNNWMDMLSAVKNDESAINTALASLTPPSTVSVDEIFTAESDQNQGRYIFVMDNITPSEITQTDLWRVDNFCASRLPIETTVTLPNITTQTVYDVFAKTSLGTPSGGNVTADLRSVPLRIYAILPKPIDHVQLTGPNTSVTCGQPFNWTVNVCDSTNTPLAASIPVHVRLLAADGVTILREQYVGVTSSGASGTFVLPANLVGGDPILKATELFTGTSSAQTIAYTTIAKQTLPLQSGTLPTLGTPVAATLQTNGNTADATAPIVQNNFGPHVRDIAISSDGSQVLCTAFNWDQNLYAVNLSSGATNWQQRAGMYFTFAPQATSTGFAVQGYNFGTAEGYGLYQISPTGTLNRRFNSYGIANRDNGWLLTTPVEADPSNNFTASPDGSWVATAGNLGLAVWNSSGTLLWSQSWPARNVGRVTAISPTALLVCEGLTITCYNATTGAQSWQTIVDTNPGIISKAVASSDSSTVALLSTDQGGRVFVLNAGTGAVTATFPTGGQDLGLTSNGALVAVASTNQLKLYSVASGLQWIYQGDSYVRFPRFNASNTDLVCTSDLGTVDVFTTSGSKLFEQDMGALCAAAWVPTGTYAGDLILASWEGAVYHLTAGTFAEQWATLLLPTVTDIIPTLLTGDGAPVTKITTWNNALGTNYPLTPNLLSPSTAYISYIDNDNGGSVLQPTNLSEPYGNNNASALVSGTATAPLTPWASWDSVYYQAAYGSDQTHLQLDTWNTMMQVTGIEICENASQPASWLRDCTLDYWNVPTQSWVTGPALLSDAATHSHAINPPIQSPRVRITLPTDSPINPWLGQVVLEGALLGCSHPDVVAGHNTCTLLDQNTWPFSGRLGGSYTFNYNDTCPYASGPMSLELTGPTIAYPVWDNSGPFYYQLFDWNMKITQTPQNANEYRYLQFAWKAVDATVTGMTLEIGAVNNNGGNANTLASLYCGTWGGTTMWPYPTGVQSQISTTVPTGWTLVTVDLWQLFQNHSATPPLLTYIDFCSTGGDGKAEFAAVKLYKTNPTGASYTAPTAAITTPANNAQFTAPASVAITSTASDTNSGGSITKVEFYNGDQLIGTATSNPYTFTWTAVPAGNYTLTSRAYDNFGLDGNSSAVNITVTNGQCATPMFNPAAGTYPSAQSVSISTTTGGATIRYTMDGSTPTETNGTVYTTAVSIPATTTLQAIAYETGMADSAVASGVYTISSSVCATPTFTPVAGTYGSAQSVTISTTTGGATIRYTTNGTTPSATVGTVYTSPVVISANTTLQAIAYETGYTNSTVASGNYNIQCAAPSFSPAAGTFTTSTSVTISTGTGGATIRYTTNGTTPSETIGTVYSGPVSITATSTLQAIAYMSGMADSPISSGVYTIQCAAPSFSPSAGTFTTSTAVTISTGTGGATIRYTTNGTTPSSTVGTVYSTPVSITATSTLQAIAYETGLSNSTVTSGVYTIQCATPTFSPAAGNYSSAQSVTISTGTGGATIRYTTNGTTPSETVGTVYSTPVNINSACTLQAIAYETGLADSGVASGAYTFNTESLPTTGMLLWLRADAITGVSNGGAVTTWTDQSGNGYNAVYTNPNGEIAPTYVSSDFNGLPAVRFSGDNLLQVSALPLGPYTIAAVFKTTGNSQIVYEHSDDLLTNSNGNFLWTSTQSTVSVKRGGAQTGKDIVESNATTWAATPAVPLLTVDEFGGTDASQVLYLNGSQQWLNENYVGNLNTTTAYTEPFNIGERESYGSLQFNGDIAEIVVYNHALSNTDFNTLNSTLMSKYALVNAPTATLTAPTNGAQYPAPASITLTATASVSGGTISKVEFYNGYTLLGTATSSPYSYTWTNVAAGSYTITAIAYSNNNITTPTAPASITVTTATQCATPTFSPAAGAYGPAQTVTISTTTGGATIRYTTDGSTPSETHGTVGTSATITATATLQAIAYETGYSDSSVASGVYTINGACATPTFSPAAGAYGPAQTVTISTTTGGATIRYTTDGSTPSETHGTVGTSATITATATLQAIAYETGYSDSSVASGVYTINGACATPTFSPAAGAYGPAQTVTISTTTGGATIRYTTDGSTPSETHGTVGTSATITATATLQAIAYETGYSDSSVASGVYTINGACATPTFSPAAGAYGPAQTVTISTTTGGATIRYTTDGSTPSETHGTVGTSATITASATLQAIAYETGYSDSSVASGVYTINGACATPTFNPGANTYGSAQTVTISTTTGGATIRYTTDGSTPSETHGTVGTSVTISVNTTLQAIAYEAGYSDSAVASGVYDIQCAAPTFNPTAGTFTTSTAVTISTSTTGATIRYTTNGTTPSETVGTVYSGPVSIIATSTLQAIAYLSGMADSPITSGVYTIQCATPTFSPAAGNYSSAQSVTISTATGGTTIRYTTNGTTPSETVGTVYSTPVNISSTCTLQAIAYETGLTDSGVASGVYTLNTESLPSTGMLLWLRADAITGVSNGGAVTTWTDQSGNGYNAVYTNPNGEVAPTYVSSDFNGLPAVRFSGDNLLQVSALPLGPYTIAAVFKTTGNSQIVYEHSDDLLNNSSGNFLWTSTQSTVSVKRGGAQTGKDIVESNATTWAATPAVPLLTVDEFGGTDASEVLYLNGSQQWLNENYVGNLNTTTAYTEPFNIGEREQTGQLQFNGDIAEIVVYNHALSNTDFTTLNNALMSKYALVNAPTASLTAPTNGAQYTAPASITLTATASVSGGTISKVEFYNGYTLLGTATSSPYSYTWTNVAAGSYTITAIAYSNNNLTTPSAPASITVNTAVQCATPTFTPVAGTYGSAQTVTISTTTGGATIRYTTDGSTPSETHGTVGTSVAISANTTLQAIAYESGYSDSAVASGVYDIQCAAPSFSPTAGTFTTSTAVTISTSTTGATIRYTANGTTPSETIGTVYSGPVSITATSTLQAIAYLSGMADSPITSGVYTIQCAAPSFSPAAGTYSSAQSVTISTGTGGATIRYTTDGSTPSETHGTVYSSAVNITATCTLQAIAYLSGCTDSTVTSGTYTINNVMPTTGMLLWLKADAITGVSNGGLVTTWTDSSGNGYNAVYTNPNGEVAPTYVTNVYNGKPVVRFNGDNLLQVSALPLGTYTIAAVFKTTGNSQIVYEHSDDLLTNSNGNFLFTSTQSTVAVKRGGAQTGKDILGAGASTWAANCSSPILTVDEFGGTDATEALFINGAQQQLVENWTGNLNNTTAYTEPFNIGEREYFGSLQFNGDIAEIVIYNHVLSTSDLNTLNSVLQAKYALDVPPTVSITAPTNNASYTAPASITLTASATANTGSISKVEFYDGNTLLGTATASPYTITWSNAENAGGSFPLTAKAYDSNGFATVSAPITITVNDTALKAFWQFNEDTGTTANDTSGNGNTGTISNGSWLPGKINCCLGFNGTSSSSSVTDASATGLPAANAAQTESFWMYVSATPSAKATALAVSGSSSGVYIGYNSSTTFGVWTNSGTLLVSTTTLPSTGAWHFISYTLSGSTNTLYIDGTSVSTSTTATNTAAATALTAGMTPGGTNYFTGDLEEIRVYNRALSAAEISGLAAGKQ